MENLKDIVTFMNKQKEHRIIKLDDFPWTQDEIVDSYWASFSKTRDIVDKSSIGIFFDELESLKIRIKIALSSIEDLLSINEEYINHLDSRRRNDKIFNEIDFKMTKSIFLSVTSLLSLVETVRRFNKKYEITEHSSLRNKHINIQKHKFIQDLRNFVIHKKDVKVSWQVNYNENRTKIIKVFFESKRLLNSYNKWSKESKAYILKSDNVNLYELFITYKAELSQFYKLFIKEIEKQYVHDLTLYNKYQSIMNNIEFKSHFNISLSMIKSKKGLYLYLSSRLKYSKMKILLKEKDIKEQLKILKKEYSFIDVNIENNLIDILSK